MTTQTTPKASTAVTLPTLDPQFEGWRWFSHLNSDEYGLRAPDNWQTKLYTTPERAIAEAQRRIISQPQDRALSENERAARQAVAEANAQVDRIVARAAEMPTAGAASSALTVATTLDACIERVIAADQAGGQALLDKSAAILEARALARQEGRGAWGRFLQATSLHERTAQRHIQIAERARQDARFQDAVRSGWLNYSVAALAAQADESLLDSLLTQDTPPTRAQIQEKPDTGVGFPADFDQYVAQAQALGFDTITREGDGNYELRRDGKRYALAAWDSITNTVEYWAQLTQQRVPRVVAPVEHRAPEAVPAPPLVVAPPVAVAEDLFVQLDRYGYTRISERTKGSTTFYTFRNFGAEKGANDETIELAAGELPYLLADLEQHALRCAQSSVAPVIAPRETTITFPPMPLSNVETLRTEVGALLEANALSEYPLVAGVLRALVRKALALAEVAA